MQVEIEVQTRGRDDWVDITQQVVDRLAHHGVAQGVLTLFVPHTTAGITVQENADPPLRDDINAALARLFPRQGPPQGGRYKHCEDNASSHMKAVLVGSSLQLLVGQGKLRLGTWQSIYLCEFDGPRQRQVWLALP